MPGSPCPCRRALPSAGASSLAAITPRTLGPNGRGPHGGVYITDSLVRGTVRQHHWLAVVYRHVLLVRRLCLVPLTRAVGLCPRLGLPKFGQKWEIGQKSPALTGLRKTGAAISVKSFTSSRNQRFREDLEPTTTNARGGVIRDSRRTRVSLAPWLDRNTYHPPPTPHSGTPPPAQRQIAGPFAPWDPCPAVGGLALMVVPPLASTPSQPGTVGWGGSGP